jgi:hypothetical protein
MASQASSSKEEFLTKEELEKFDYKELVKMDNIYSFKTSKKTKSTRVTKDAIVKRLLKEGVEKSKYKSKLSSYAKYEFEHPLAKTMPSGNYLPPDIVGKIYTMKEQIEDREYEIEFVKAVFQPKTLPANKYNFFDFMLNGSIVNLSMTDPNFQMHVVNLYSPTYFIKDYKFLVSRLEVNAKKMRTEGVRYTEGRQRMLANFFSVNVIPTYSRLIVINNILRKIEAYRTSHTVLKYPQEVASRLLEASYERYLWPPNNPLNVLKFYIKDLNKMLLKLRDYKILLNPSIIKDLNKSLDTLNDYLVEPDPSIEGQANAKFSIRVLDNGPKFAVKSRYYSGTKSQSLTKNKIKVNNTKKLTHKLQKINIQDLKKSQKYSAMLRASQLMPKNLTHKRAKSL